MNDRLLQLYSQYWDGMIENIFYPQKSAYPYLIQTTPLYQQATKRVMICGQETLGWVTREHPDPSVTTVKDVMNIYNHFVNKDCDGTQIKKTGYNSPYWNFQWRFMSQNPNVGFVVQNIVKIGKRSAAGCDNTIYQLTKQYFPVWMKELEILEPDCIIFLTGTYDERIREIAGNFKTERIPNINGVLDKLIFDDKSMPVAYRTNHPRYLQSNNLYREMSQTISDIISRL